jgi:hypothetical protein
MRHISLAAIAVAVFTLFGPINRVAAQDYWGWGWGWHRPWGYTYRPACPYHYFYDCRRGPYGNIQCACWPW